jgi:hypothetical protein
LLALHLHTVTLRLYEPPTLDAALLRKLSDSLTNLGPGTSSALDIFYQSSTALKAWFDAWLTIPVMSYYSLPQPTFSLIVYAVTMLGRWAKYAVPPATLQKKSEVPLDPSADNPNVALAAADASRSTPSGSSATPSSSGPSPWSTR